MKLFINCDYIGLDIKELTLFISGFKDIDIVRNHIKKISVQLNTVI